MSERWHQIHDDYVREHGDDARPEAVALADDEDPYVFAPGAVWLVNDPLDVQIFANACGLHGSGWEAAHR